MSAAPDRALLAARHGLAQLELGQMKNAAWYGVYALDLDPACGLAWALLARIVVEVAEEPLGTMATRHALSLPIPEPEHGEVERFFRIELWSRGYLHHGSQQPLMPIGAFDSADHFSETPRYAGWLDAIHKEWGSEARAIEALRRMAASISDAWIVPDSDDNPLKSDAAWQPTPAFAAFAAADPLKGVTMPVGERKAPPPGTSVLSDYWMEQEIMSLGAQASFELALDRARLWARLRPKKIRPRAALVRVLHATKRSEERDRTIAEILDLRSNDLNELEDARVALGETELWKDQIKVLDQMLRLAPAHPVILANRGVARIQIGERVLGENDLADALESDPMYGPALANLGLQRMRADDYVAARHLLERAVQVAPQQPQVRVYLAACKNNQDDRPGAIAELEEALRLDPDNAQAKQLLSELKARGPVLKS